MQVHASRRGGGEESNPGLTDLSSTALLAPLSCPHSGKPLLLCSYGSEVMSAQPFRPAPFPLPAVGLGTFPGAAWWLGVGVGSVSKPVAPVSVGKSRLLWLLISKLSMALACWTDGQ